MEGFAYLLLNCLVSNTTRKYKLGLYITSTAALTIRLYTAVFRMPRNITTYVVL